MHTEKPPLTFREALADPSRFNLTLALQHRELTDEYRPWWKVRYIARDLGVDAVEAWASLKAIRFSGWSKLDLTRPEGGQFGLSAGPYMLGPLHRIDRASGNAAELGEGPLADRAQRRRLSVQTLMDEATESSLIEGAATTRKDAVEMLRAGRQPRSRGERMVFNNYAAMQQIKSLLDRPLSVPMLLELQGLLTEGTLDDPGAIGRLRRSDEDVRVVDMRDDSVIYTPPPAAGLTERLSAVCDFAGRPHDGPDFLHPVVKACILHFMVGYEHPFVDGNGRTARAVFYWFALKHGYPIFEFLSISEIIRQGIARYPQAYLDTELDEGDLTYFVLYKLGVIEQALARLAQHLQEANSKLERSQLFLRLGSDLNNRQRLLLENASRDVGARYTVKAHANSNDITPTTARADLEELVRRRLLTRAKGVGKEVVYVPPADLEEKLARKVRDPKKS